MTKHLLKLVWNRKRANLLIVVEIFISYLVLFAVLTAAITFGTRWNKPLGFQWQNVWDVSMEFDVDAGEKADPVLHAAMFRMIDEARSFPEIAGVALSNTPAYSFSTSEGNRMINNRDVTLKYDDVTDGFADAMQMKVIRGRWFNAEDDASPYWPVVLAADAAEAIYGDADPIGLKIEEDEKTILQVVGVVETYRKDGEVAGPDQMMFRRIAPNAKYGRLGNHLIVRINPGTAPDFEQKLASRLEQILPHVSFRVRNLERMRMNMLRTRLAPVVVGGIIGAFLIAMVALGLTGVLWQSVTRRTREIGLRRAMGASGPNVHRQILSEVALLSTIAVIAGSIIILQLPILGAFRVVTPSAFTLGFTGALATIYALTILCGLYPSWLASRLQPADALRYE
ncbi:MAG TPA: FtsX-like permease family protein [Thermoanaerobaculia bacterium]|nr:FtsX-like permease family protein [Thermoanaerobaculia bacterium]